MENQNTETVDNQAVNDSTQTAAATEKEKPEAAPQAETKEEPKAPEAKADTSKETLAGAKQGQPEQEVKYDFTGSVPEGAELDANVAEQFGTIAKGLKLNNEQANQLAKFGMEYAGNAINAFKAQQEQQSETWAKQTKQQLGADFDKTIGLVGTAVETLEKQVPNLRSVLNEYGVGNRPEIVQVFAIVGKMLAEDGGHALQGHSVGADAMAARYPKTDFAKYK